MATLGEIVQQQGYRGDPALGGGYDTPIVIDTGPLDNLARYSFLYNREMSQRREADTQLKAQQLADLAAYDLQAIPEESTQLRGKWDELYNYVRANPDVLDYKNNPTGWMEYNKKKNEFVQVLNSAKQRNIVWQKWQTDIAAEQNPETQARLKKELADNIKSTNINIPLPAEQKYDIAPVTTEAGSRKVIDFTVIGDNSNTIRKVDTVDFASIGAQADAKIFGLNELINKEKAGTPEQQKAYAAQVAAGKFEPVISAQTYKEAMANLKKDGDGNYINVPQMVLDVWAQIDNYNKRVKQEKTIVSGLKDKFERPIFGGQSGLKEADYVDIDKENFSARDLLKMRILAQSAPLGYTTTTTQTDNKIQIRGQDLAYDAKIKEIEAQKEHWSSMQKGGETVKNGAYERAKTIYSDLLKLADSKGFISPDKVRQLNVEQLKYMGIEQPPVLDEVSGKVIPGGMRALDLSGVTKDVNGKQVGDINTYGISLDNGEIRVIVNPAKDFVRNPAGDFYYGRFDNTKSTNLRNIATNILNEELQKAGSKELNSYMPVDLTGSEGGVSANTSGASTTTSGSDLTSGTVKVQSASGKVYVVPQADVDKVLKANVGAKIIQ